MRRRGRGGALAEVRSALALAALVPATVASAGTAARAATAPRPAAAEKVAPASTAPRPAAAEKAAPAAVETTGGVAYEGSDRAVLRLAPGLAPAAEEYANAGYRLRRGPGTGEVIVEVSLAPLASRAPFVAPAGEGALAARSAVAGAETVHQAVTGVLGWIVHNVSAAADDSATAQAAPAMPAQVVAAGAGDAASVARLAVAMLGAVGIEARTVSGRVVGPPRPGAPHGRHVWIEVRYPDRGWVFSDPLHHHHYVPASYLRLSDGAASASAAAAVELVERDDRRVPADVYRGGGPGVGARRNDDRQVAAALRVVVPGAAEGAAVLTAADGSKRRKALLDGEGVFVGLAGGAYTLEVLVPGRTGLSRTVELAPRERSAVYFGGEAAARREPAAERPSPPPAKQPAPARRRAPR